MKHDLERVRSELCPNGVLRVGLNMRNFLLVSGEDQSGQPTGVSPDLGKEIANRLGAEASFIRYPSPGAVVDAATTNEWDIGNVAADPARGEHILFSPPYCEIEATFIVPAGSPVTQIDDIDQPDRRIVSMQRSAYDLWLEANLKQATLVHQHSLDDCFDAFVDQKLDALAGLRPRLLSDVEKLKGARILDGKFMAVKQAIGTMRKNATAAAWLSDTIVELVSSGKIESLIKQHAIKGLSVSLPQ